MVNTSIAGPILKLAKNVNLPKKKPISTIPTSNIISPPSVNSSTNITNPIPFTDITKMPSINNPTQTNNANIIFNPNGSITYQTQNKTYNLTPAEYKGLLALQGSKEGGITSSKVREIAALTSQRIGTQAALQQIGNLPQSNEPQIQGGIIPPLSSFEQIAPNLISTGIGAGLGALVGGPAGAAVGAFIGGGPSIISSLKENEIQNTKTEYAGFIKSQSTLKSIIDGLNKGYLDPIDAVNLYNSELSRIDVAERNLKALSEREWLSKSKDELIKIQAFNETQRPLIENMLRQALQTPNPNQIFDIPLDTEVTTNG